VSALAGIDRVLAPLTWLAAALVVVMLLVGPEVVAEDKAEPTGKAAGAAPYASGGGSADGKTIFVDRCGSCHTLGRAGTTGGVGPSLDDLSLEKAEVERIVREGRGGMPAFDGQLSPAEISAVAAFVAGG
jgi:mono/diheme cytochrome c family protein